jgi:CBS domain-containing protein
MNESNHGHVHDENCDHGEYEAVAVSTVMTPDVFCATADTSLAEIAQLMRDNDCGAIPIIDDPQSLFPIGIVTDRDITVRVVAESRNPLELTARDAMSEGVVTISPDADLEECLDLMEENQLRRIVVVDDDGAVVGLVAQADIVEWATEEDAGELVQEISEDTTGR